MTEASTPELDYLRAWLQFRREFRDLVGLVVAIARNGEVVLSEGFGFANLERAEPVTPRHVFRIASHSKMFTATAIMQLVEQGRLRLDDLASTYLAWFPYACTLRQLLNHTSGIIRDGIDADHWLTETPFPDRAQLCAIASQGRILEPNQRFKYSNIGYGLLGLIVEAASGVPYTEYVRRHIVEPLELKDTGPDLAGVPSERLVTGYAAAQPRASRRPLPSIPTNALASATGFYSTAEDLCRFAAAHFPGNPTLLSDASKREMQQPYWAVEQAEENYGLGFSVRTLGKHRLFGHGGGFPGQSTRTMFDAEDRLVVVVLSNSSGIDASAGPIADSIVHILDFAAEQGNPEAPERFAGRFANLWAAYDITPFGKGLFLLNPALDNPVQSVTRLEVVDLDTLRITDTGGYGSAGELVRFERDPDDNVRRVVIGGVSAYPTGSV